MSAPLSPLRKDRITASRVPAVLGISPYATRASLMREMVREHFDEPSEFAGNIATDWGNNHEADAIAEYELTQGVAVHFTGTDQQTLVSPAYPFLAATPDGLTADRVVETKAPWRALYTSITERPDYAAQIQLQLAVTDYPAADLVIWRPDQPLIVETVDRDFDWLQRSLPAITEFLEEYERVVSSPELYQPHREPLKDVRTDGEWLIVSREWLELDFLIKQLEAERDRAAKELMTLSPDKPARGNGIDLLRYERRGTVQYKKILDDLKIKVDLERYRAASSQITTVRRIGDNKKESS